MRTNLDQISVSTFEDQRLKQTDFTVIHDIIPSIGAGPSIALFKNSKTNHQTVFYPGGPPSSERGAVLAILQIIPYI